MLIILFHQTLFVLILFNCSSNGFCLEEKKLLNDTFIDLKNSSNETKEIFNDSTTIDSVQLKDDQANQYTCPYYTHRKEKTKKDLTNFFKDSYNSAIELCNTSSRVGCKYSDFLNLVSTCINEKYFGVDDIILEMNENKELNELPQAERQPVIGFVSFKIVNVDAVSIVKMDFKIDFYLGI